MDVVDTGIIRARLKICKIYVTNIRPKSTTKPKSNLFPSHTQAPQVSHHVPHPGPHQVPYAQFQINPPQSNSYFNPVPVPSCLSLNTSPTSPIPSLSCPNPVPLPTPMTSTPRWPYRYMHELYVNCDFSPWPFNKTVVAKLTYVFLLSYEPVVHTSSGSEEQSKWTQGEW